MNGRELLLLLGGAMTAARGLGAQQKSMPVIGFLGSTAPGPFEANVAAFRKGLSDSGYVDGQNVAIEYRWAEDRYDRLPGLAADLVSRKVDVIATGSMPSALAAKKATSTIPVVFETGIDPVEAGLVASFARPGGNLTGVCMLTAALMPRRLELLLELVPQASLIGVLVNPTNSTAGQMIGDVKEAARAKGVRLAMLKAGNEGEIDAAFVQLVGLHADALLVIPDPSLLGRREQLAALALRHAIPAIYPLREFAASGGLISYAASVTAAFHLLGIYAGRVLKGEKPADLPVQQPTIFELVVNLKAAKALSLTVPPAILARADEVIE
jgi:putative tryptophan/tyrosine transport system substrate-binding protein